MNNNSGVSLTAEISAEALSPGYENLAGEYILTPIDSGHFRYRFPDMSQFEWLDLQSAPGATVLWFGSESSANCHPGQWGRNKELTADELQAGTIELPSVNAERAAAVISV